MLGDISSQYILTYIAFLVLVPLSWWLLFRTSFGMNTPCRRGESGSHRCCRSEIFRLRYLVLALGGEVMAIGGAFLSFSN